MITPTTNSMTTFKYHAAQAKLTIKDRIAEVDYSGPISSNAFKVLRDLVTEAAPLASCFVIRMDKSLTMMGTPPAALTGVKGAAPGAVIVREDQYELWRAYAAAMSHVGVIRIVFLESQLALCREWVDVQLKYRGVKS